MMTDVRNLPWVGGVLTVVGSTDPSLVGRSGLVTDETRHTLRLHDGEQPLTLGRAFLFHRRL
jgi:RNase P/RNase MRP subunit p29